MEDLRRTALFIDADDTLIETKSGKTLPENYSDWQFKSGMMGALHNVKSEFDFIFVVTNQGGIEAGHQNHFELRKKFNIIQACANNHYGVKIQEVLMSPYFSYHYTRKPFPEFAYRMAIKYQLDLQKCVMIGDASGITEVLALDKKGPGVFEIRDTALKGTLVFDNDQIIYQGEQPVIIRRQDFSDSDRQFAKNAGMNYIDVEEFLREKPESFKNYFLTDEHNKN